MMMMMMLTAGAYVLGRKFWVFRLGFHESREEIPIINILIRFLALPLPFLDSSYAESYYQVQFRPMREQPIPFPQVIQPGHLRRLKKSYQLLQRS